MCVVLGVEAFSAFCEPAEMTSLNILVLVHAGKKYFLGK